jgi:hypothetical protein
MRIVSIAAAIAILAMGSSIFGYADAAERPTRFWNLTSATVIDLRLAPAETGQFGDNQCLNDKDAEVEHDERVKITGVADGAYDAKIGFSDGRVCRVKNLPIEVGKVFSIEDKDLFACSK